MRDGRVAYMGDIGTARAHVLGKNDRYVGVCIAGNYEGTEPDARDLSQLKRLVRVLDDYFGRTVPWRGHRDVMPPGYTVCPGQHLELHVATLRDGSDEGPLHIALRKWADVGQAIQPNEDAALYKTIRADDYWPISDESGANGTPAVTGYRHVAQLARALANDDERIYWWDGSTVRWIDR